MPVMNGFEATCKIREMEANRSNSSISLQHGTGADGTFTPPTSRPDTPSSPPKPNTSSQQQPPTSALIIALTGLASGRDQAEAFSSGVDVFLTKPISFKEVGKLLDNWERHDNVGMRGGSEESMHSGE